MIDELSYRGAIPVDKKKTREKQRKQFLRGRKKEKKIKKKANIRGRYKDVEREREKERGIVYS